MRRLLVLCGLVGCGTSSDCLTQLEGVTRQYLEAVDALDGACTDDADCVLVSPDLTCVAMCKRALKTSQVDQFAELQSSFSARCPGTCNASIDCVSLVEVARCRDGLCRGETLDGG